MTNDASNEDSPLSGPWSGPAVGAVRAAGVCLAGCAMLALAACDRRADDSPAPASVAPAAGPAVDTASSVAPPNKIEPERLAAHVRRLASDEFGGRGVATPGEDLTVEYIAAGFRAAGLEPAFGDSYFQFVPLVETVTEPESGLIVEGGGQTLRFDAPADVVAWTRRLSPVARPVTRPVTRSVTRSVTRLDASELVFAGYGIVAPEYGWDDYAGLDVRGKTVIVLINDPGYATRDPALFNGRAMTYYGRWSYKFEEAARQGARGALIVHQTAPAAYPWSVVMNSWTGPQFDLKRSDGNVGRVEVEGWISEGAAREILGRAGQDLVGVADAAALRGFRGMPLELRASIALRNTQRDVVSRNVVGWLPGSVRPGETILFSAHWDHLGTDLELDGDQIYNGAADNATGVAALMEQARVAAAGPRAPRSLVFAAFTAEETGFQGSRYFAESGPFELATMVAVLNTDRMNYLGPARDVQVRGYGASELDDYLRAAAAAQDRIVVPEPLPERGLYYRSDHFSFVRHGVPGLHVRSGIDYRERARAWGAAREDEYLDRLYHKPGDEYRDDWDLRGAAEDAALYLAVARALAIERRYPAWSAGSEFRAVRERSADARAGEP